MTLYDPCSVLLHRHTPVVACDEIFVNSECCGGHIPIAVGASVWLDELFSIKEEQALGESDGFSRQREDALEIKNAPARASDHYHVAPPGMALGIEPPSGADEQCAVGEGGFHTVPAYDHRAKPESE